MHPRLQRAAFAALVIAGLFLVEAVFRSIDSAGVFWELVEWLVLVLGAVGFFIGVEEDLTRYKWVGACLAIAGATLIALHIPQ